jgi:hypothetical protein
MGTLPVHGLRAGKWFVVIHSEGVEVGKDRGRGADRDFTVFAVATWHGLRAFGNVPRGR